MPFFITFLIHLQRYTKFFNYTQTDKNFLKFFRGKTQKNNAVFKIPFLSIRELEIYYFENL